MTTSEDKITTITDVMLNDVIGEFLNAQKDWEHGYDISADIVELMREKGWVHIVPAEPTGVGAVVYGLAAGREGEQTFTRWTTDPDQRNPWMGADGMVSRWPDMTVIEVLSKGVTP